MTTVEGPTERQLALVPMRDPEIGHDLSARLHRLARRHAAALEVDIVNGGAIAAALQKLEIMIRMGSPELAKQTAEHVVANLVDPAELSTVQFWETALGRAVAVRGAFPEPWMTRSIAAALLDVSRQRIGQMVSKGMLTESGGRLTSSSVVWYMAAA